MTTLDILFIKYTDHEYRIVKFHMGVLSHSDILFFTVTPSLLCQGNTKSVA